MDDFEVNSIDMRICDQVGITQHLQPFVIEVVSRGQTYYSRTVVTPRLCNTCNQVESINIAFNGCLQRCHCSASHRLVQEILSRAT